MVIRNVRWGQVAVVFAITRDKGTPSPLQRELNSIDGSNLLVPQWDGSKGSSMGDKASTFLRREPVRHHGLMVEPDVESGEGHYDEHVR